jgi:hypothetical protein
MKNVRNFVYAIVFIFIAAVPAKAQCCFVSGQVHPQFRLEVAKNGSVVKTVTPKPSKPIIFLTQIDQPIIVAGENSITVRYDIVSLDEGGSSPVPSFKVQVRRQTNLTDKNTATDLVELRGPRKPYKTGGSGTITESFQDQ